MYDPESEQEKADALRDEMREDGISVNEKLKHLNNDEDVLQDRENEE